VLLGSTVKFCGHSHLMKPHPNEDTSAVTSSYFTLATGTPQRHQE